MVLDDPPRELVQAMSQTRPKVALVRGPIVSTTAAFNNEATPAIGFAYIAAYIAAKKYTVEIVDAIGEGLNKFWNLEDHPGYHCQGLTFDQILARIPNDTDVIGISAMFSGEWPVTRALAVRIRTAFPKALIVAGGEHITALTEYSLRDCPAIDLCVRGEGEHTFFEVLEAKQSATPLADIAGVAFLDDTGAYVSTGNLPRIREVDAIPWPLWPEGYLEHFWAAGKSYGVATQRDMPIMASRGCPYQCTFCSNAHMWTTRYILRDIDDLVGEIKTYRDRYDITALQFYDLTAITKKRWTVDFCNRLIAEGIDLKWSLPSGTRSEALDQDTLGLLKKTGCNYLVYAPESGSPETLEKIKKRIDLKTFTSSVVEAKRQGLILRTNLIIGFPHERRRHVFETIRYGLYLAIRGVDEVSINIFSPYPGTEIFDDLVARDIVTPSDDYFLSLTSLNSDYTSRNPLTVNPTMGPRELAAYRLGFMLLNYTIGYLLHPGRIIRTLRNIFSKGGTATVLEHRLRDVVQRRRRTQDEAPVRKAA